MPWRVFDPEGRPVRHAVADTRRLAISRAEWELTPYQGWRTWKIDFYPLGYRCRKVQEVPEGQV